MRAVPVLLLAMAATGCFATQPPTLVGGVAYARSSATEPAAEGQSTWDAQWYYEWSTDPALSTVATTPVESAQLPRGQTSIDSTALPASSVPQYYRVCGRRVVEPPAAYECQGIRGSTTRTFQNGVLVTGDPKVFLADGRIYMVRPLANATGGAQLLQSADASASSWSVAATIGDATNPSLRPPTMVPGGPGGQNVNFWGTEVALVGSTFVMTTSGNHPYPEVAPGYYRGSIFLATATSAAGPYTWKPLPVVTDPGRSAIDPSIFQDPATGKTWLTWTDHVDTQTGLPSGVWGIENYLWAQELDAQLNPVGPKTVLLSTDVDPQNRERAFALGGGSFQRIIEGQGVVYRADNQTYYLYYGAGTERLNLNQAAGEAPYSFDIATSSTFPARFTKSPSPLIQGQDADPVNPGAWGRPGHGSMFVDGNGQVWAALHARSAPTEGWRLSFIEPLVLTASGFSSPTGYLTTTTQQALVPCVNGLTNEFCQGGAPKPGYR